MSFRPEKAFYPIGNAFKMGALRIYCDLYTAVTGYAISPKQLTFYSHKYGDDTLRKAAAKDLSHAYVDIFVETWRASAYLVGHFIAFAIPFLVVVYSLY